MIFHRLGLMNKNQMGFTLIEMIIVLAIAGVVTGGTTMTIFQVLDGSSRTSNHMTAVRQVQNAGYWVSRDAQMAQIVTTDPGASGFPLTLAWTGWEYVCGSDTCISSHEVRYTYDSDKLWRYEKITTNKYDSDGRLIEGPIESESSALIAEYITPIPTATMDGNKLMVTITASVVDAEEERTYEITPRPST